MKNPRFYTGVGSRETPETKMNLMTRLAKVLEGKGYILRSGGAIGADTAFENGATEKIIYKVKDSTPECEEIAARIHPAWHMCSDYAKKLHGRNVKQVLGDDLKTPSDFLLCWTKEGKDVGGTRTAIVLAGI